MIVDTVDRRSVRAALELACRAPSVHNSQPWRWTLGEVGVQLHADLRRWLPATDGDGRDLVVSCGAALHHLRVALAASGLRAVVHRLPDAEEPDRLADLELHPTWAPEADIALASAITARRTDRRAFADWEVPRAFVEQLVERAAGQGVVVRTAAEPRDRTLVLRAIADAARVQQDDVRYRSETAAWSGGVAAHDGIPAANLLRDPAGGAAGGRRFRPGLVDRSPGTEDGALLLILGTASDDTLSQLRTGEALSAMALHATQLGLATCPLSQPLEVGDTRDALRDGVLGGTLSPQLVLRVGWAPSGPPLPATPRRPLAEVVEQVAG